MWWLIGFLLMVLFLVNGVKQARDEWRDAMPWTRKTHVAVIFLFAMLTVRVGIEAWRAMIG